MLDSQHDRDLEPTRPLVARLCNTVKDMIYCLVLVLIHILYCGQPAAAAER